MDAQLLYEHPIPSGQDRDGDFCSDDDSYRADDPYSDDLFVCLLLFYVLATSKVTSGRVPTCDSAHSWRLL